MDDTVKQKSRTKSSSSSIDRKEDSSSKNPEECSGNEKQTSEELEAYSVVSQPENNAQTNTDDKNKVCLKIRRLSVNSERSSGQDGVQPLAGDRVQQPLAGDRVQQPLAGDCVQQPLAGDRVQQTLAVDGVQLLAGDVQPLAGDRVQPQAVNRVQQPLAVDCGQPLTGDRVHQTLAVDGVQPLAVDREQPLEGDVQPLAVDRVQSPAGKVQPLAGARVQPEDADSIDSLLQGDDDYNSENDAPMPLSTNAAESDILTTDLVAAAEPLEKLALAGKSRLSCEESSSEKLSRSVKSKGSNAESRNSLQSKEDGGLEPGINSKTEEHGGRIILKIQTNQADTTSPKDPGASMQAELQILKFFLEG